jgi:hypothetical protein
LAIDVPIEPFIIATARPGGRRRTPTLLQRSEPFPRKRTNPSTGTRLLKADIQSDSVPVEPLLAEAAMSQNQIINHHSSMAVSCSLSALKPSVYTKLV